MKFFVFLIIPYAFGARAPFPRSHRAPYEMFSGYGTLSDDGKPDKGYF